MRGGWLVGRVQIGVVLEAEGTPPQERGDGPAQLPERAGTSNQRVLVTALVNQNGNQRSGYRSLTRDSEPPPRCILKGVDGGKREPVLGGVFERSLLVPGA